MWRQFDTGPLMRHISYQDLCMNYLIFSMVLLMSLVFDIGELLLGFRMSSDVRTWWPFGIALAFLISLIYATLFAWIAKNLFTIRYALVFNLIYRVVHFVYTYMFYTGAQSLVETGAPAGMHIVQQLAASNITYFALPIFALGVQTGAAYLRRRKIEASR